MVTFPPRLGREEAVTELGRRWKPGDHVTLIGPTGRGKSTLIAQLLPHARHDLIIILCPKGADPVFKDLGLPTAVWPPGRSWVDQISDLWKGVPAQHQTRPIIWRIEVPITGIQDFDKMAGVFATVLRKMLARTNNPKDSVAVVLDDSRLISDPKQLGQGPLVVANMSISRAKNVSLVNNYQAPRWVPREGLDQGTQILMWRNRDRDVVRRLGEIGDLDPEIINSAMASLEYYECLWIDGFTDELHIISQK